MTKEKYSVSIHQPDFIPYFGFFNKISKSDTFVIMDNVQLSKSGWTHRDQIKTKRPKVVFGSHYIAKEVFNYFDFSFDKGTI